MELLFGSFFGLGLRRLRLFLSLRNLRLFGRLGTVRSSAIIGPISLALGIVLLGIPAGNVPKLV